MDFSYSDEQRLLRDSVGAFLRDHYDFETRRKTAISESGWRPEIWKALGAELGVLGMSLPERVGGFEADAVTTMLIMEEFGRSLLIEPYLDAVVIAGGLLAAMGGEVADAVLGDLIAGEALPILAWSEVDSRNDFCHQSARAELIDGEWQLSGEKVVVRSAPWASHFIISARIVSARTEGKSGDEQGISLFLVDAKAPGLSLYSYPTIDGRRAADLKLDNVRVSSAALLGERDCALPVLEEARSRGIAALCAEAVGVMDKLLQDTVEYCKQRRQFGQSISSFQALQHRMVDMYLQLEMSRSACIAATLRLQDSDNDKKRAAASAKITIAKACRFVGQNAVQLHGGMGMTDELAVSHYFKRATAIEQEFGGVDFHLAKYDQLRKVS